MMNPMTPMTVARADEALGARSPNGQLGQETVHLKEIPAYPREEWKSEKMNEINIKWYSEYISKIV